MSVPVTAARLTPELSSSLVVLALTTLVSSVTVFVSLALVCCVLFAVPLASASILAVLAGVSHRRSLARDAFGPAQRFQSAVSFCLGIALVVRLLNSFNPI